jgi:hypothetical protein
MIPGMKLWRYSQENQRWEIPLCESMLRNNRNLTLLFTWVFDAILPERLPDNSWYEYTAESMIIRKFANALFPQPGSPFLPSGSPGAKIMEVWDWLGSFACRSDIVSHLPTLTFFHHSRTHIRKMEDIYYTDCIPFTLRVKTRHN